MDGQIQQRTQVGGALDARASLAVSVYWICQSLNQSVIRYTEHYEVNTQYLKVFYSDLMHLMLIRISVIASSDLPALSFNS